MPFDLTPPVSARLTALPRQRAVALWLFIVCGMILVMVSLGGATRLTGSGLSIMEWAPLRGILPPLSDAEWRRLFALYQQIPQYELVNHGLGLEGFKGIFWLEWTHRFWGRLLGVAFAGPLLWFAWRRAIGRALAWRLGLFLVLGGLQGAVGWFMVASGFAADSVAVSAYRLVMHLGLALLLYAAILWTALDLWQAAPPRVGRRGGGHGLGRMLALVCALVALTIAAGGFVAGLRAGLSYNTFPLMDGRVVPEGYAALHPWVRNLTENVAAVQFNHRLLASLTLLAALGTAGWGLLRGVRSGWLLTLGGLVLAQYGLGISTLLHGVPVALGAAHQAVAVAVLTAAMVCLHQQRPALAGRQEGGRQEDGRQEDGRQGDERGQPGAMLDGDGVIDIGVAVYGPGRHLAGRNRRFTELFPDAAGVPDAVAPVLEGRVGSIHHLRPDGVALRVQSDALPDGGWVVTVSDISALAQASVTNSVLNHVPHGISIYGPDRRLRMVNSAYARIMEGAPLRPGDSLDEVVHRRAAAGEFGPGDPAEIAAAQLAFDLSVPQRRRRRRPNGTVLDVRTAPLPDGGHMSVVTDVTPLTDAQAELSRRADTLDAMLACIRHGIILWDADRRIVACNPVVEQALLSPPGLLVPGRSLEEVIQSALDRGNLGDGEAALARAKALRERDRTLSNVDQRLTRAGRVLEVRSDPTPGGGFVTTYTDVTSIRQAEAALRLAKQTAETANAAKSRFLAALSEELHAPLNAIIGTADSLTRSLADSAGPGRTARLDAGEAAETVDGMAASARQLRSIIDTVLDVARIEGGRFEPPSDVVDIPQLVRLVVQRQDAAAAAAEVALVVELPPGLPLINGDPRRLRQALGHLVGNGIKFTPALGTVRISAAHDPGTGELRLEVADNGGGIPEAELDRVFEPFTRLDRTVPAEGGMPMAGTGLGLYLSRALMRVHGGDVTLRSHPGQGTVAVMHVPSNRVLQPGSGDPI